MNTKKDIDKKVKNLAKPKESRVEKKLIKIMLANNGAAIKQTGQKSMPDRLCIWPFGKACFVELKKTGKKPDPLQLATHAALRRLGFKVYVIWNDEQLKQFERDIHASI